ncbi:MAG: hypothetical protein ABI476_05720, partial [Oxalobacteraceae bacterium]
MTNFPDCPHSTRLTSGCLPTLQSCTADAVGKGLFHCPTRASALRIPPSGLKSFGHTKSYTADAVLPTSGATKCRNFLQSLYSARLQTLKVQNIQRVMYMAQNLLIVNIFYFSTDSCRLFKPFFSEVKIY